MTLFDIVGILALCGVLTYHFTRRHQEYQARKEMHEEIQALRGLLLLIVHHMQIPVPPELRAPMKLGRR